ncbi:MAG: hypothetical protein ACR2P4_03900 [Gammaproteobacteria bacterium]
MGAVSIALCCALILPPPFVVFCRRQKVFAEFDIPRRHYATISASGESQ